jgi:SWI/SNF-related matrix-associated actin-dependent regulator 1 of chromatin subfamily A
VDVTYDKQLIELFKSIGSKSYDSTTKMWTFGLKDHNTLIKSIKHTLPYIKLSPIPAVILNTFISTIDRAPNDTLTINYSDKIGSKLYSTLMGFQKQGIEYCIRRGGRCLIADDMGLGKTLQAIGVALYYHEEWPLLIVCPSSLKISWAEALQLWVPSLSEDNINVVMTTKGKLKGHITIISYDLLSRMSHKVDPDVQPGVIIVDESHFIKCYKAARTKAVIPLIKKSKRALLLSGTPALSRPIELYTQITSLENKFFMSLQDYGKRYCNGFQGTFGWNFSGSSNMTELQLYMEHKLMIRRLKRDVLDQLPSKRRQTVILQLHNTCVIKPSGIIKS